MKRPKSKGLYVSHIKQLKRKAVQKAKERDFWMEVAWMTGWTVAVFFATLLWFKN